MKRIWKDIRGLAGRYQVSNDGFVRSLPDIDARGRFMPGKVLSAGTNTKGYLHVAIDGKSKRVHILVAKAFIPNPNGLPEVNHLDGDKGNANAKNLEWSTSSDNHLHSYRVLGRKAGMAGKRGIACKNSIPVSARRVSTGKHVGFFGSAAEAGRALGIYSSGISLCVNGKMRSYKGMQWTKITRRQYENGVLCV